MVMGLNKSIISKLLKKHTNKSFMGFINSLLENYGINIKSKRNSSSKYVDNKKVSFDSYYYCCDYIKDLNKFI